MSPITIAAVEAFAYRVPIATPIKVAFGTFRDRPFVLIRVVDAAGTEGWARYDATGPRSAPSIAHVSGLADGKESLIPAAFIDGLTPDMQKLADLLGREHAPGALH